jgi:phosphoacetylglucosamine mutase
MASFMTIKDVLESYSMQSKTFAYGTAGFRDRYDVLHNVFVRMGILACLRSASVEGKCIGVMITASHNPEIDNGLKIVDFDGGMLTQSWEPLAERLANCSTSEFLSSVEALKYEYFKLNPSTRSTVMIARDMRPHSAELANCVRQGILAFGGVCFDLGEVVTPMLHWVIHTHNLSILSSEQNIDCEAYVARYFHELAADYLDLLADRESQPASVEKVIVDASCGVGSVVVEKFLCVASLMKEFGLSIDLRNKNGEGPVNEGCGAELVQKNQRPPKGVNFQSDMGQLMCSFDGDGDRIVFHAYVSEATDKPASWILLDGDKIAALLSSFIASELAAASLTGTLSFGVVQTAYANGASTRYLKARGVPTYVAKTGVKFVHHKAQEFDIGVYFEANGHGTVLFSNKFNECLEMSLKECKEATAANLVRRKAIGRLQV